MSYNHQLAPSPLTVAEGRREPTVLPGDFKGPGPALALTSARLGLCAGWDNCQAHADNQKRLDKFSIKLLRGSRGAGLHPFPLPLPYLAWEVLETQPGDQASPRDDSVWWSLRAKLQHRALSRVACAGWS